MIDANLTLNQLTASNNGARRLKTMIGAKNIAFSNEENFVSFKFMSGAKNKANYMKITLNSMDTYDVEFGFVRGTTYKIRSEASGLYDDMLKAHFEKETGLYLTM